MHKIPDGPRYEVTVTVDDFERRGRRYDGVTCTLFRRDVQAETRLAGAIEELFTDEEADMLIRWVEGPLAEHLSANFKCVKTPYTTLPLNVLPTGDFPIGGPSDFISLASVPGYDLPFVVWVYYDISGCPERTETAPPSSHA